MQELVRERDRVVRRLRSMELTAVPVDRVLAVAQALADLAATATGEQVRVVPRLQPYAAADQIAVLVGDLVGRSADEAAAEQARVVLADLRRDL